MVKIKQCGPVFFQALHEVLWQVADLKVIPGTGNADALVFKKGVGLTEGRAASPPTCKGLSMRLLDPHPGCLVGWRTTEDRGEANRWWLSASPDFPPFSFVATIFLGPARGLAHSPPYATVLLLRSPVVSCLRTVLDICPGMGRCCEPMLSLGEYMHWKL